MKTVSMKRIIFLIVLMFLIWTSAAAQDKNKEMQITLEQFCKEHYADCFVGREYLEGSLIVTSVDTISTAIKVKGRHNYVSPLGTYTDVDFKADIIYYDKKMKIIFYKWFVPLFKFMDGRWESCTIITNLK